MDITIKALLSSYRDSTLTPQQVVDFVFSQCERCDDYNIWITRLTEAQLRPYLDRLEKSSPQDLPLYGIPFAIKDNIDLADVATTAGCEAYRYVPSQSAFVIDCLIKAGAIPIGKTNMDQFATGLVGTRSPEPWGACKNAFNKKYISGGSSAGSAVAVALGMVSFSLGTDTAGSGRVPAALNNIIGVKPSKGLISTSGVVPACRSLDCVSVFALTTDDANLVLNEAIRYDESDVYARKSCFDNNARQYAKVKQEFVFGIPQSSQLQFFANSDAQALYHGTIARLELLGGKAVTIDFNPFINAARLLYEGPWVAERYVAIEELISNNPEALLPVIKTIISEGRSKTAVDAFKSQYKMQAFRNNAQVVFNTIDFMLLPTTGTTYTIDEVNADPVKLNSNLGFYTNFMNLLDCAGVAVPAGMLQNGLPWGVTLVAPAMRDRKLLSYASLYTSNLDLSVGTLDIKPDNTIATVIDADTHIAVIVCGAHLDGLPLNWQLTERGAVFEKKTTTSPNYKFYVLPGDSPQRPGLVRDESHGVAVDVEVWRVPKHEFGSFVEGIPHPLGIGRVELRDGSWHAGFLCEAYVTSNASDISSTGGWKSYLNID